MKHEEERKKRQELSDERLEAMLRSSAAEDMPRPPVVNTYRLEREKARRQDGRQLWLTAAAVWISMLLTAALAAAGKPYLSAYGQILLQNPRIAKAYVYLKMIPMVYGRELLTAALVLLSLCMAGYILCGVLLMKERSRPVTLR